MNPTLQPIASPLAPVCSIPLAQAEKTARAFLALLSPGCYRRAEIAGSVRRREPLVKDIEIVIEPAIGGVDIDGLFGPITEQGNLLWQQIDLLLAHGVISRHIYPDGRPRWGQLYRGLEFSGATIELFTADAENWGSILCIRTGPADFNKRIMSAFNARGMYRQEHGRLIGRDSLIVPVPDEQTYFRFACIAYQPPGERR